MSFTEDELQAFNSILEQRFTAHRQEMEQALDRHLDEFRQDIDQRLITLCQEMVNGLKQGFADEENGFAVALVEKLDVQREQITKALSLEVGQRAQHIEASVDRMLAAQLLGLEQLLQQQGAILSAQATAPSAQNIRSQLEAIEVQTEIPWEELVEVMGKVLDKRLVTLDNSLQRSVANLEQYLAVRLHGLRDEIVHEQSNGQVYNGSVSSVQEILEGIGHLERIVESMQVAMTANHALLSNRLYHHQQLPLERAHPVGFSSATQVNESASMLAQARERIASGQSPVLPGQTEEEAGAERQ